MPIITGGDASNHMTGRSVDDTILGLGGDDTLLGGAGGNVLDGGQGNDTASYAWAAGAALVNLADGFAEVDDPADAAPAAVDLLSSIEHALGGAGNDTLVGS